MMRGRGLRCALRAAVAAAALAVASGAHGQVYKCTDAAGKTTYSDAPCDAASKPLKLPGDPGKSTTNPSMCAQLLDETRRLAAEAGRQAAGGHPESAESAKRRETMNRRYQERCVGITRSGRTPG
jgi:hypothetical protein